MVENQAPDQKEEIKKIDRDLKILREDLQQVADSICQAHFKEVELVKKPALPLFLAATLTKQLLNFVGECIGNKRY